MKELQELLMDNVEERGVADIILDYKYGIENIKEYDNWLSTNLRHILAKHITQYTADWTLKPLRKLIKKTFMSINYEHAKYDLFTIDNSSANENTKSILFVLSKKSKRSNYGKWKRLNREYSGQLYPDSFKLLDINIKYTTRLRTTMSIGGNGQLPHPCTWLLYENVEVLLEHK